MPCRSRFSFGIARHSFQPADAAKKAATVLTSSGVGGDLVTCLNHSSAAVAIMNAASINQGSTLSSQSALRSSESDCPGSRNGRSLIGERASLMR
jgi:hypothetical protein